MSSTRVLVVAALALGVIGCGPARNTTIAQTFPTGASADPWERLDPVWHGDWEAARPALDEAEARRWSAFEPQHVWVARYVHRRRPLEQLTVRTFGLPTEARAAEAFEHFRDPDDTHLPAQDEGVWLSDGVRVRTGRLLWEVFSSGEREVKPEQALYLYAYIEKRLTPPVVNQAYPSQAGF